MIREARLDDCAEIAGRINAESALEIAHAYGAGASLVAALEESVRRFPATLTGCLDGRPEALFGLIRQPDGARRVWFVGTADLMRRPVLLTRTARALVGAWRRNGALVGDAPEGTRAVPWLRLLGFDIEDAIPAQCGGRAVGRYHRFRLS